MQYVLLLCIWTNAFAHDNAVTVTSATFQDQQACEQAGARAVTSFHSFWRDGKYICQPIKTENKP